jgi:LmbE family N-acetylglucosaminyl deacetylase
VSARRSPRLLVIAPHPDDETLGAGGLIQRVLAAHGIVRVVLVTAGDGYVEAVQHETGELRARAIEYVACGERRLREARAAMWEFGHGRVSLELLGFPDRGAHHSSAPVPPQTHRIERERDAGRDPLGVNSLEPDRAA